MAFVITQPCEATQSADCVEVCPVKCIHQSPDQKMYFIDPIDCIDCGACVTACPVEAIYALPDVPSEWKDYVKRNEEYATQFREAKLVKS